MKYIKTLVASAVMLTAVAATHSAKAQMMQVGTDQFGTPMCVGPLGPQYVAPCGQIQGWIMQHQNQMMQPQVFNPPVMPFNQPAPPAPSNNNNNNGLPPLPTLGQDEQAAQVIAPVVEAVGSLFGG